MKKLFKNLGTPITALLFAIIIGAIIVVSLGYNPLSVYASLLSGAFGGVYNIGNTLAVATPLLLTGLGIALAFRAGLFNIGAEGQYWVGAMAAVWVGYHFTALPGWIHAILCLVAGMIAGGLWGGIVPGITKAYVGAHEVITTMMMSYIGILLARFMIEDGPMKQKGYVPQSPPIASNTIFTSLFQSQLTVGILIAVIAAVLIWVLLYKTTIGFQLRIVGLNQRAARYAGIRVPLFTILALGLSGMLAGLAGSVQMLAVDNRLTDSFNSGYGYTGIVVALLARSNPIGVIPASIFFAALNTGGQNMQQVSGVPSSLTDVLTGLIVFFVAAERLIPVIKSWYRTRRTGKHSIAFPEGASKP